MSDERPRAEAAFDELPVGTELGSIEYELSEEFVRRHTAATNQTPYPAAGRVRYAPVSRRAGGSSSRRSSRKSVL